MKKRKLTRLQLTKDTLRNLSDSQIAIPAGGYPQTAICSMSCGGTCVSTCALG